ncbi:MAG: hypothetical protein KDK99_04925, partial [Verrucomicrobiales bacterium]|nr:hypothetical protein [Verrucomicrobiales bacterium]
ALVPSDGGVYVANSTELLFLQDTDGDLKEDRRTIVLSGFGTEDTHHLVHTLGIGPEGLLNFLQSIYIHSHIETPHGVRRLLGGGVWEYRPETRRLEVISKGLINPWGFEFDRWGQSFATDGAGSEGVNFVFPGSVFATSPGASRILHGLSPGQPKHCGLEIIEEPTFPADWQGNFITCDFRGNRVNRFKLESSGSGYTATQLGDVIASTHRAFRPIDVKIGPDGALYIADWYNPIIQHGEVDFRDPRRDHVHGRIWRIKPKANAAAARPELHGQPAEKLVESLRSDRRWVRHFAKQELRQLGAPTAVAAIDAFAAGLKPEVETEAHDLLEAAWAREGVNAFSPDLWQRVWGAADARVRAGALRILTHRWREMAGVEKIAAQAVADASPQVRLWGVVLCGEVGTPTAIEIALRVLDLPMDENLDFLLEKICAEHADTWLPQVLSGKLKLDGTSSHLIFALRATRRAEALKPLFAVLQSGELADEEATAILQAAGATVDAERGGDLAGLAEAAGLEKRRESILDALLTAAQTRKVRPADAAKLTEKWLAAVMPVPVRQRAAQLAGLWKVEAARPALAAMLADPALRSAAVHGLADLGGEASRDLLDREFQSAKDLPTKAVMLEGLAKVGPILAAQRAVAYLSASKTASDAQPVIGVFLSNKQLPNLLAKALADRKIPQVAAVEAIRMVTTRGIQGPLVEALKKAGGVKQMDHALSAEEMAALVKKVQEHGDAHRGEAIYRRQQLLCMTCHAIGDAGGLIGPNLVSIGASAPVDYLIESLLEPSKKIKEGYHMVVVTTKQGQVVSGGLVQDSGKELIIRDPTNKLITVASADVASRQMSPVSMMPPGLTAGLREDEFVDLVKFLSELGREGDFKITPRRFVRTWRVMGPMQRGGEQVDHVRHVGLQALHDPEMPYPWLPFHSEVSGAVPVAELGKEQGINPWFPHILQFALKLDEAGSVKLALSHAKGTVLVVDDEVLHEVQPEVKLDLAAGTHHVTVLLTRDGGFPEAFSVEILEGAAKVVAP